MPEPHRFLADCPLRCSSRAAPLRFQDSLALKELCRTRSLSLCGDAQQRRALPLSIHVRRRGEMRRRGCGRRPCWTVPLVGIGAQGGCCSVNLIPPLPELLFRSREAAVTHVKDYYVHKFASPSEPLMCFTNLPCAEPDFTQQEVSHAVLQMKTGKTTGMSHVSVELLRCLVARLLGLHALTAMLNAFLWDPLTCSVELAAGWVILLPKTLWVNHAQQFRPIVCGEAFAKLAAKLATCRVVHPWAVPSCFGSVSGKGLPEALYIAKHAAESSALLPTAPVFLQLDLSQAFNSLLVNSIVLPCFGGSLFSPGCGLSCLIIRGGVTKTVVATALPCLAELLLPALNSSPTIGGAKGDGSLQALWFIDDAILLLRSVARNLRLLPQVVPMPVDLGLTIN